MNNCTFKDHCVNLEGSYQCTCPEFYTKNSLGVCIDLNECDLKQHKCEHNCINQSPGYNCSCNLNYELNNTFNCTIHTPNDSCTALNCQQFCNFSTSPITCSCRDGYKLNANDGTCDDVDECSDKTHKCDSNAECKNLIGSYRCECKPGFKLGKDGITCEKCSIGLWGKNCESICRCKNSKDCNPKTGCSSCPPGFQGGSCDQDIDECTKTSNICGSNGKCVNLNGTYECNCDTGFKFAYGKCSEIDECVTYEQINNKPACEHGGHCLDKLNDFECNCTKGYNGLRCENDIDVCGNTKPCQNNGVCTNLDGLKYSCNCTNGYTGVNCQFSNIIYEIRGLLTVFNRAYDPSMSNINSEAYKNLSQEANDAVSLPKILIYNSLW